MTEVDTTAPLAPMPDDWERCLAIVAHPDDMEYGASAAVAAWTNAGKSVAYVLATYGEAGIDGEAVIDAVRDAGNRWVFTELVDRGLNRGAACVGSSSPGRHRPTTRWTSPTPLSGGSHPSAPLGSTLKGSATGSSLTPLHSCADLPSKLHHDSTVA